MEKIILGVDGDGLWHYSGNEESNEVCPNERTHPKQI